MRYTQAEKMEIIKTVEDSELSVRRTLEELDINRGTFYQWYERYSSSGYEGLANRRSGPRKFWNRIPEPVKQQVVDIALEYPEKTPRELAWHITDTQAYFISESSVYRILKAFDLVASPAYIVISAKDKFQNPTKMINELWQTDFTYFKIGPWGWHYLATVLDDYSRYIISWQLFETMSTADVKQVLDMAIANSGVNRVKVQHRPRLLSDNGPCYISGELQKYLAEQDIQHTRSAPYHPMTQGKIERYHRSLKNVINLDNYSCPEELKSEIERFVDYYNNQRYHESLENLTPANVYYGQDKDILTRRQLIKIQTLKHRRSQNNAMKMSSMIN
jgi:putative transposase